MKSSSIADSVFSVNLNYAQLQNKSKELFFRCLDEGRSEEYFEQELRKIWGNNDTKYLENEIAEYRAYLYQEHTGKKMTTEEKKRIEIVDVIKIAGAIVLANELYKKAKTKEYKLRLNSYGYKTNKEEYLEKLVPKYSNDIKPYYRQGEPKTRENLVRYVSPNTYNSMVYNTVLTRNGWIQTLNDADEMDVEYLYIPSHSFSCPYCAEYQEKPMTIKQCYDLLGTADEQEGDLLHPNCKCELVFYDKGTKLKRLNMGKIEEQYHIRQQVNSLTLKKEELLSDKRIYKRLGSQEDIDKTNQQIKKINSSIKDLQSALPTTELKKQVVAINR